MKATLIAVCLMLASQVALAERIVKTSPHTVGVTVDRLAAAVEKAGARVFARVDHAAGAKKVGQSLAPMQMLMFRNPKLGTPALQGAATMGLDLPLRVLVYANADAKVMLTYHDPADVAAMHGLPADHGVIKKMRGALNKLTGAAVSP